MRNWIRQADDYLGDQYYCESKVEPKPVSFKRETMTAYCSSEACVEGFRQEEIIKPNATYPVMECPDCQHYLKWECGC